MFSYKFNISIISLSLLIGWYFLTPSELPAKTPIDITQNTQSETFDFRALDQNKKIKNFWGQTNIIEQNEKAIHIFFPKGSRNPGHSPRGGAWFYYSLKKPEIDHKSLTYTLRFDEDFNFVKGGKIPGFCGGTCPRGGSDSSEGFSTRFMWREGGQLEVYGYFPGRSSPLGESLGRGMMIFETGKEYTITQEIKLNTPGESNGIIKVYIDEVLLYKKSNINYRNSHDVQLDTLFFATFFGGASTPYETPIDTSLEISDLYINNYP